MAKNSFLITARLNDVVKQAKIEYGKREGALMALIQLALNDKSNTKPNSDFDGQGSKSATVGMSDDEYDRAKDYRKKRLLDNKKDFLIFAIKHGATLYLKADAAEREKLDAADKGEKAAKAE